MHLRGVIGSLVGLAMLLLSGCGSGGSGSNTRLAVSHTGAASATRAASTRHAASGKVLVIALPSGQTIEINQARFGVREIDLETELESAETEGSGADEDDIEFRGPFVADVVNSTLLNADGSPAGDIAANFPEGTLFEEVEFKVKPGAGVHPDPLRAASMFLHGTLKSAGGAALLSFKLTSLKDEEVKIDDDSSGGVRIDPGTNVMELVFAMGSWFTGVDLTTANQSAGNMDADGDVLLDDTHNTSLRDAIVRNIREGLELFEDDNHDGEPEDRF